MTALLQAESFPQVPLESVLLAARNQTTLTQSDNLNAKCDRVQIVTGVHVLHLVELRGIEPLTFSMRTRRATNCATAP